MLTAEQVLTRLNINSQSRLAAVQDVRAHIEGSDNPIGAARAIIANLISGDFTCNDPIVARMTAQSLVSDAIEFGDKYDDIVALKRAGDKIAGYRVSNPWFFYKPSSSTVETTTETREGIAVEVKTDGKLKKGGKQVLAMALYEKHKALTNKEIIAIFEKELDMSKPGATTYLYNCKKAK